MGICATISAMSNLHKTIFETLRGEILSGKYNPREKFPSEEQLRRRFKTSRSTLRLALLHLKECSMIETRNGSGTFLSSTARNMSGRLGLIVPHIAEGELSPPICAGIEKSASENGYSLLFGDASSTDPKTRASRAIALAKDYIAQNVAGVFLEPIELVDNAFQVTKSIIDIFKKLHIPIVLLDRDIVSPPQRSEYDLVSIDNVQIGYRLATHLIDRGAEHICFFARPGSAPTVQLRFQGAREAALDHRPAQSKVRICLAEPTDVAVVGKLLSGRNPPDAFLCANDLTAVSLMKTLETLGKEVPRDILVTGIGDVKVAATSMPPLTTVRQPCGEIAKAAVAVMLQRLRNPSLPPRQILLDSPLIVRQSTTRRRRQAGHALRP